MLYHSLCLLSVATVGWQLVSGRSVAQQQPAYPPYADYSYTYAGPLPFHQQPYQSPLYSPPGTYFDQRQGILRPFPGGGVPVLVDYHKRCSNQYLGLKGHPDQQQYYYLCKPDCVIFGKCQNLQIFNATSGQCVQHPPPEYVPICSGIGRFPLYSDCHLYYKCEEDLQPKIYSCPEAMVFSPASSKCISGSKCIPTRISPQSSYIPEYCANQFPPCFENGIFRSPSDCSLYYKCDLKKTGVYIQTRLRCPQGEFYDLQKNKCLPAMEVPCDCIQVAEIVYPKENTIPYAPAMYPSQYDFDALEEMPYPVEQLKEESPTNCTISESKTVDAKQADVNTNFVPIDSETDLNNQQDIKAFVLSDYLNIGDENDASLSHDLEELTAKAQETTVSSEETSKEQESGLEEDSEETAMLNLFNGNETKNVAKEKGREVQDAATTDAVSSEEEKATATRKSVSASHLEQCEDSVESDEAINKPTDTLTKDTPHTKNKKCLPKLTFTSLKTDIDSTKTTKVSISIGNSSSSSQQQNSRTTTTVTTIPTTTQLVTTAPEVPASKNLEMGQSPMDDNLALNLLDANTNSEARETTQSAQKKDTDQITHKPAVDIDNKLIHMNLETSSKDATQTIHTRSVQDVSLNEDDISYEDILDADNLLSETQKMPGTEEPVHVQELEAAALTEQTNHNPFQHTKLEAVTANMTTPHATAAVTPLPDETTNNSIDPDFLDSSNGIDWNKMPLLDRLWGNNSTALQQIDFEDEELLPAHSKPSVLNELTEQTTDFVVQHDGTTIFAENEITTTTDSFQKQAAASKKEDGNEKINTETLATASTDAGRIKEITSDVRSNENLLSNRSSKVSFKSPSKEVSSLGVNSAEALQTVSDSVPLSPTSSSSLFTPTKTLTTTAQLATDTNPKALAVRNCTCVQSEKHSNNLDVHVRSESQAEAPQAHPHTKSLYYILKKKPVINNNNNQTVAALNLPEADTKNIPRLEIIAGRPIDVHFSISSATCKENHEHNFTPAARRAVLLKWFANKSNETMGFETANDINADSN